MRYMKQFKQCVQTTSRLWILRMEDSDNGLFFDMAPKIDLAKYVINIIELGGDSVNHAVTKGLILYRNVDFLPYPPNTPLPNTKFFNLFLGFKAKPAIENNSAIMDPILWHAKNIISDGNEELSKYFWYWCAYLVLEQFKYCVPYQVAEKIS